MKSTCCNRVLGALTVLLAALVAPVWAQPSDIDIYTAGSSTDKPNVLFIFDSSANWSANVTGAGRCYYKDNKTATTSYPTPEGTKFAIEMCALYNTIDALPVASTGGPDGDGLFNIAITLMNESPKNGGYPRVRFLPLTTNNKAVFKTFIKSLGAIADKANNADYGQAMYEAYLWYKQMAPLNGTLGSKWDHDAVSGGKYVSPSAASCGRNYVIVIGNGSPQVSNPEKAVEQLMDARIDADLPSLTTAERNALKTKITDDPNLGNDAADWADEMARFMNRTDVSTKDDSQGIVTHAIAVLKGPSDGNFPYLMQSMARNGGGSYYATTSVDQLTLALGDIFNQLQAVNSVFASASLPVSVNARGTYLNQVYMGMFRPDENALPRWRGNVKQYKFGIDSANNLFLVDSAGNPAISAATGFFDPKAISFWTTASTYWTKTPLGTPKSASDSPDGEVVEKGSVAQGLRTTYPTTTELPNRKVYTCIDCSGGTKLGSTADTLFNDANTSLTQALLGVASSTDRTNLINWLRGANDVVSDKADWATSPDVTTVRPSIHGDVLHSRPAVVNFGGTTGIVVFYGANDGQLHAINGNQSGTGAGQELWSFVPKEQVGKLKRLRDNAPEVKLSTTVSDTATSRDYMVDGPIGVYQKIGSGGSVDKAIIYVGMRRGGREIYAIDVTTPSEPKFLWKVSNSTSADLSLLGQTWSEPRVALIKGSTDPVLIFGGGYDTAEDTGGTATTGNAVFVLNALNGTLLRRFTTLDGTLGLGSIGRPVPADVTLVDSDYDGKVDRAYAADLGGQIYRIDFESATGNLPVNWTIYKVADLSGGTSSGRKFFYAPDVVLTKNFAALMIGSGDREKPLKTDTQDHFFEVFDRRLDKGAPLLPSPVVFSNLTAMGETSKVDGSGCYMALATGEKVVNAATSIAGSSYFGTNRPSSGSTGNTCSANLGVAKSYAMPLFCVASSGQELIGGGLPPSPVAGVVTVTKSDGSTVQVPFVIGAPNPSNSGIQASRVKPTITAPRQRRYWYQETQR